VGRAQSGMNAALSATRHAHAKLNLWLEVGPKSGRLHEVVSAMATLALADELVFAPSPQGFHVSCLGAAIPESENLVWRAARELVTNPPGMTVTIRKHIPLQAGLGGGSADAAETLYALAQISATLGRPISPDAMRDAAAGLGSDVPALVPGLKIVSNLGERVTSYPAPIPPWGVVLFKPAVGSDTAQAYALLDAGGPRTPLGDAHLERARSVCAAFTAQDFAGFLALLHNDFTQPVEAALPAVAEVRTRLEASGAAATILCGSGSCVAGFFEDVAQAHHARASLSPRQGEWCAVTQFYG
jgi:4-diphosphocytidyl-2-C-methyl-D-erythritol kinase